jgi:DNA-binding LytR/AlgR family response regulator
MINCFVLDDESSSVELIEKYIDRTAVLQLAGRETDALLGLKKIVEINPDLVFLDIQMPGCSGLDIASQVPSGSRVIFTTAYRDLGADAYDRNAIDFLSKPIAYQRFMVAINKYLEWHNLTENKGQKKLSTSNAFFVNSGTKGVKVKIEPDNIVLVEAKEHYTTVYLCDGSSVDTSLSLGEMELVLPENLKRVHRSFIANLDKVEQVMGYELQFISVNKTVTCGRDYRNMVKDLLHL